MSFSLGTEKDAWMISFYWDVKYRAFLNLGCEMVDSLTSLMTLFLLDGDDVLGPILCRRFIGSIKLK